MAFDPSSVVRDFGDPFAEALACRRACAVFDFSFVARGRVSGPGAVATLRGLTARRMDDLAPGRIRYALRTAPGGHLVSDLTIWRHPGDVLEVMSGRREDIAAVVDLAGPGAATDLGAEAAIFAVQGPQSLAALRSAGIADPAVAHIPYYGFCRAEAAGVSCLVGRLGYTGEAGFEVVVPRPAAAELWGRLAAAACPAGFAAADILRIEAGFVLFANEFGLPVTASEAGLSAFASSPSEPPVLRPADPLALVCFRAEASAMPVLWQPPTPLGRPRPGQITVTSACHSPHLDTVLGLGFVRADDLAAGRAVADPSGVFTRLCLVPRPAIDPGKVRPRAPWPAPGVRP